MSSSTSVAAIQRLNSRVEIAGQVWLVLLPLLRPLLWSGQPTDVANLFFLVLLAAAITTGLLLRGLNNPLPGLQLRWWSRPMTWGLLFFLFVVIGCVGSPLPAAAWTLVAGWALHIAAPLALLPLIRRHPQLVFAGLIAGLGGELLLLIGQVLWERPHLVQQLAQDPTLTVEQRVADQYRVRIGSWRLEGTFLLANTLATYLLLVVPLVLGSAWRCRERRWAIIALALSVLVALVMTGSKAGLLALVVTAVLCALVVLANWRWRLLTGGVALLLVVGALAIAPVRSAAVGSAGVRLDYWRAGVALVGERPLLGHGLEGFSVGYPRVKPPAGEETILAHQELLQAAVDLGVPAAVVLLAWWCALLYALQPRAPLHEPPGVPLGMPVFISVGALLVFACVAAGVLQTNFTVYPGHAPLLWSALLIVVCLALAAWAVRLPLPPPWACWAAVLAGLLHVQADFSLHSMQVVGVLAWVAIMGLVGVEWRGDTVATIGSNRRQGLFAAAGLVVLMAVAVGVMLASVRSEVLERARQCENLLARMRLLDQGRLPSDQRSAVLDAFEQAVARVVVEDRQAALASDPREALAMAMIRRAVDASRRFPADHDLVFAAVALAEHLQALLPMRVSVVTPVLEHLLAEWPQDLLVTKALSEHYLRLARSASTAQQHTLARQAQALAQRAVELYPSNLPLRQTLIAAAELTGDQVTVTSQRAEIARLAPLVHPDNRPR